ncbi:MAG: DUF1365 domain-containing protein [Coriobacteriia bacterium]|nr:DUF1365 domain-containing protein [Coriobacteriia bacterium]
MSSALYVGTVRHERRTPRRNAFRYGLYYIYVDLDELADLDRAMRLFAYNHGGFMSFWDRDHGPRDGSPLRPWVDDLLARAGVDVAGGKVFLLAFPRVLGFRFYPVALWYCFDADGLPRAILAEVCNTFGEHHNYLLHAHGHALDWKQRPEVIKVFHVSPFIEMDGRYEFHFTPPADKLAVSIHDYIKGELLLVAGVSLRAREITDRSILATVFRYGPMSPRAWILIRWQALRIVAKRIRYIPRPAPPNEETSL